MLPAWLMLKLSKPLPMCISLVRKIQQLTELEWPETVTPQPLLSLITSQASNGTMENGNNRGLFVVSIFVLFFWGKKYIYIYIKICL